MKIIADSSSSRTEWVLVDGTSVVERAFTSGINPYLMTRREISRTIRLELPASFFRRRWSHVYFYGAGCANRDKIKIMESSLIAQFKTPVSVGSNMLGAARGLLVNRPGLACILGTGSNSCLYNGRDIVKSVPPLGFILGDEGSSADLGKAMVAEILKGLAPADFISGFYRAFEIDSERLMEIVYTSKMPNRELSQFSRYLADNIDNEYAYQLVYRTFLNFFNRNIAAYDYIGHPISFVGATAVLYSNILKRVASDFGAEVACIEPSSMPGLIRYHAAD